MHQVVGDYLGGVLEGILAAPGSGEIEFDTMTTESTADAVFEVLTSKTFCHLSRTRTAPYRMTAVQALRQNIAADEPVGFSYDIGAGYRASLYPGSQGLSFRMGLSELLILGQIAAFSNRISAIHPPGARFWLVLDNLCGSRTNDVPLERTAGYISQLRELIDDLGLAHLVDLIVEAELVDEALYDNLVAGSPPAAVLSVPSSGEIENVSRFLGRYCDASEAAERMDLYRRTGPATELVLAPFIRGVHLTQRATGGTLGFRAFHGGDSRMQCGEVALSHTAGGVLHPFLLTSRNASEYETFSLSYSDILPTAIRSVTYARRLIEPSRSGQKYE